MVSDIVKSATFCGGYSDGEIAYLERKVTYAIQAAKIASSGRSWSL